MALRKISVAADSFTPALGYHWLTPLYDGAIALMTSERRWRRALLEQVAPRPGERLLDVGCGTGTMAIMLKRAEPAAEIIGLDPDDQILARATRKAALARVEVGFRHGFLDAATAALIGPVDKITCSLVLHQVPLEGKTRLLETAYGLLRQNGTLHIVDYGLQRTWLMRTGFRLIQLLDGFENTEPNARGVLPHLMEEAGFSTVEETRILTTMTGSISMYRARSRQGAPKDAGIDEAPPPMPQSGFRSENPGPVQPGCRVTDSFRTRL